jgi:hypothetical protein
MRDGGEAPKPDQPIERRRHGCHKARVGGEVVAEDFGRH